MYLTRRQKNILIGLILGDGCLEKNGKNVRLRIEHGIKQMEYLKWLANEFANLSSGEVRRFSTIHSRTGKRYTRIHFSSLSLECFNEYHDLFYINRRKIIPEGIGTFLKNSLSLAIWFMDDGYKRNDCQALRIGTESFLFKEQLLLKNCLSKNFGINCCVHRKKDKWNLYIPQKDAVKFCSLIGNKVIPKMKYKLI